MRLATVGLDLPTAAATRIGFRDRVAFEPFDVLMLDPDAVLDEYAPEIERHEADPVLSVRGSQALLADLRRRRSEMMALLLRGGAIVFHPPGQRKLRVHTLEGLIDATASMTLPIDGIATMPSSGAPAGLRGGEPFAAFQSVLADDLICRDVMIDPPGERLFSDTAGRAAGFYLARNRGHVLAVPRTRAPQRFAAALATLLRRLRVSNDYALPDWTHHHRLPGEDALRTQLQEIEAESGRLQARLAAARAALHPFEQRKLLLTASGRALYDAACLAFWDLGCAVYQGPSGETDLAVEWDDKTALVETIGREGPIVAADVERLIATIAALPKDGTPSCKPVLLTAAHRDLPLGQRPQPEFSPDVVTLAQRHRVALIPGHQLLGVAASAWQGRLDGSVVMRSIFAAIGPVSFTAG